MPIQADPNVLVGHVGSDDAGVYRISNDSALVLTVDFFTPIVDDPFDFGRVAATNSLSDVYAMGGRPVVALNIAGFPEGGLPEDALADILRGGAEVAGKAGVAIIGGHTIKDNDLKYGLAVVGMIHPDRIVSNSGAKPGDSLVLTKPLGTGVLATALRNDRLTDDAIKRLVNVMTTLNREASDRMLEHGVHACTDITGFGLLGHAGPMAGESDVTIEIFADAVPVMEGALVAVRQGQLTGGAGTNRSFVEDILRVENDVDADILHLFFDPQTAGGLLISLPGDRAQALVDSLRSHHPQAAIIGRCRERSDAGLVVLGGQPV